MVCEAITKAPTRRLTVAQVATLCDPPLEVSSIIPRIKRCPRLNVSRERGGGGAFRDTIAFAEVLNDATSSVYLPITAEAVIDNSSTRAQPSVEKLQVCHVSRTSTATCRREMAGQKMVTKPKAKQVHDAPATWRASKRGECIRLHTFTLLPGKACATAYRCRAFARS